MHKQKKLSMPLTSRLVAALFCLLLPRSYSFHAPPVPRCRLRAPNLRRLGASVPSFEDAGAGRHGAAHRKSVKAKSGTVAPDAPVPESEPAGPPSSSAIVRFTLPVSVICLTNFVMGAIDTVSVGRFGGTLQLGALSPATAGLEYVCYAFACLPQSTLVLLGGTSDDAGREKTLSVAMAVALVVGLVQGGVSFLFASRLMTALGAGAEMLPFAVPYIKIRALSLWAYYLTLVGSASCFSKKDSVTPFVVTLLAGSLNFAGNYVLCPRMSTTTAGAAIATAVSQYAAVTMTMLVLWKRRQLPNLSKIGLPKLGELFAFVGFAGKISIYTSIRIFVYGFCSRMCTLLGAVSAAASQVATNVWWGGSSFTAEPLESAILAFLPKQLSEQTDGTEQKLSWTPGATTTLRRHLKIALGLSALVAALLLRAVSGNNLSWLLDDPGVLAEIPRSALGAACFAVGPMLVFEGALLTVRKVGWVTSVSAAAAAISCGLMVLGQNGHVWGLAAGGGSVGFHWWMVSLFVGLRLAGNAAGVFNFARKNSTKELQNVKAILD